jgi:protease I
MANNKRVACLLGDGFEDSEFKVPYDALKDAGYEVDIIGAKAGKELAGKAGKVKTKADRAIDEVRPQDYAALLIPGGHSPDNLRKDERFVQFVREFDQTGRPLAAVCHGPQLLMAARVVKGRTLTAWQTIQRDLELVPGVKVVDQEVARDANWVTSRKPDDLPAFTRAFLELLERQPAIGDEARI